MEPNGSKKETADVCWYTYILKMRSSRICFHPNMTTTEDSAHEPIFHHHLVVFYFFSLLSYCGLSPPRFPISRSKRNITNSVAWALAVLVITDTKKRTRNSRPELRGIFYHLFFFLCFVCQQRHTTIESIICTCSTHREVAASLPAL